MNISRLSIYCPHCHKHTSVDMARTGQSAIRQVGRWEEVLAAWPASEGKVWWIGVCNACQGPVLVLNYGEIIFPHPPSRTD